MTHSVVIDNLIAKDIDRRNSIFFIELWSEQYRNRMSNQSNICAICSDCTDSDCLILVTRGIKTLLEASKLRKDQKHVLFESVDSVYVYKKCRNSYTKRTSITATAKRNIDGTFLN